MTLRYHSFAVLPLLPLLFLAAPAQAQKADTTTADTADVDTTVQDTSTTGAPVPDPAVADTGRAPPTDTAQAAVPTDTLAADIPAPSDTTAADTLSGAERRAHARKQARAAAESWLSLTDAGRFGESWEAAAPVLQEGISREKWVQRGTRVRSRLDTMTSRTFVRAQYRDSTRQIPGGQPVVALQYETEFAGQSVLEAVIATKPGPDWAVAGYRVVPNTGPAPAPDSTQAPSSPDSVSAPDSSQAAPRPGSVQASPDSTQGQLP
jgi:hypothetical protein